MTSEIARAQLDDFIGLERALNILPSALTQASIALDQAQRKLYTYNSSEDRNANFATLRALVRNLEVEISNAQFACHCMKVLIPAETEVKSLEEKKK